MNLPSFLAYNEIKEFENMRRRGGLNFNRRRRKFNMKLFKEVSLWIIEIAIVMTIAYVSVSYFGVKTSVVGSAMESTLNNGDHVLINRFVYMVSHPKQGDVIVFFPNGNEKSHYYIRRVMAVPGDKVIVKDGVLYVNDKAFEESSDVAAMEDAGIASEEIVLGEDEYFVLGDNRNNSEDSRYAHIGNVKSEYIVGRAWYRITSKG